MKNNYSWMRPHYARSQRSFVATVALVAGLFATAPASAGTTLYENGPFKADLSALVVGFGVWADGSRTDLSQDDWSGAVTASEFSFEPQLDLTWDLGNGGEFYSRISWGFAEMHGQHADLGFYFPDFGYTDGGLSSRREWLNFGYRDEMFDISVGSQDILIGNGLLVGDGYSQVGSHGGNYFIGVQKTFSDTAVLKINKIGDTGFRTDIFWLDADDAPIAFPYKGLNTEAAAINVEYDLSRWQGVSAGTLGAMYLDVLDSDLRDFRDGREYYDFRALNVAFDTLPNWTFSAEVALQDGRAPKGSCATNADPSNRCKYDAYVWYASADYSFADVRWTPTIGYRYYEASGDSNPNDDKIKQHEALFYTATGWETWFQGQIWGEWIGTQENQRTHLVRASIFPAGTYQFDVHYVRNEADVGGLGYSGGDSYLDEINLFAQYYPGGGWYTAVVLSYGWIGDPDAFADAAFLYDPDGAGPRTAADLDADDDIKQAFFWIQKSF